MGNRMVRVLKEYLPAGHTPDEALSVCTTCVSNRDYLRFVCDGGRPPRVHPKYPEQRTWDDHNDCPTSMLDHPVVYVAWEDAVAFCRWLTKKEREAGAIGGRDEYGLPTLAQWQAFARGSRLTPRRCVTSTSPGARAGR